MVGVPTVPVSQESPLVTAFPHLTVPSAARTAVAARATELSKVYGTGDTR
ncbi:ABC transporter ATP-binding protein, partial [Streptomyces sp. SID11233]|nr:ABC transporter ATP-binding protein [Streptomyces sp. SID11233]